MLTRAYSILDVKSVDSERRVIAGIATSPTPDRVGDVMEPLGAKFQEQLTLLLFHDATLPVGTVKLGRPTRSGIPFTASFPDPQTIRSETLRERVMEAIDSVKLGLIRAVSIGFKAAQSGMKRLETGGIRFSDYEILELSLVVVPANAEATISVVKSLDAAALAAPGTGARRVFLPASRDIDRKSAMSISEQIAAEKAELQTKSSRLEALMAQEDAGTLDDADAQERDALTKSLQAHTQKIERLSTLEAAQMVQAKAVSFSHGSAPASASVTAPRSVQVVNLEKGTAFARYAMAVAAGKGSYSDTLAYARKFDGQTPEVSAYVKAVAGTTENVSPGWGYELYKPTMVQEFVDLLRPATIIGRVPGFNSAPFGVPIVSQTGGSTFQWVGEMGSKPVGELAFESTSLGKHKVAGIVVLSEELVRFSSPAAETLVRNSLIRDCAKFLDEAFIQVAKAAGTNNPASITNGVSSPAAGGTTLAKAMSDLNTALATFDTTGSDGLVWVMPPSVARTLSLMVTSLGSAPPGFSVSPNGGTLLGYPVIVSGSVDAGTIVLFKPSEIFLADDGAVRLDASNQATLDMDGGSPPTATFSLWQNNCVGLRAERFITWQKARSSGVVAIIDTVAYVPGT